MDGALASMADSLGYYFHRRGLWALGEQWHERAIDLRQTSSHAKDETALSHELYRRGVILAGRGTPHAAVECLRERLRLDEKAGDRQGQSASLHQMAIIESSQGNPTEARRLWEESVAIEEDLGSPGGKASTLVMLAQLEASEGNFAKAVEMVREALSLLESVGSGEVPMVRQILQAIEAAARGEVVGGGGRAGSARLHGEAMAKIQAADPEAAVPLFEQALAASRAEENAHNVGMCLLALAQTLRILNRPEEAAERLNEGRQLAEELGDSALLEALRRLAEGSGGQSDSVRLHGEAVTKVKAGDRAGALAVFEESLAASRNEDNAHNVAMNLLALGRVLLVLGRPEDAVERLREGLETATTLGNEDLLNAMRETAMAAAQAAAMEEALAQPLDEALAEAETDGAKAQLLLARAAATAARAPAEAEALADRALALARACSSKRAEVGATHLKGMLAATQGRLGDAKELLRKAQHVAEEEGMAEAAANLAALVAGLDSAEA
ncbi:MAG: tetratricopeptide repeat protein [Armatimonadetes bacterium]|nr:tetratricopeptide repeat protein [Armatimonadota bacterium]NCP30142.1 tetratricopeptide repeat protein [Armatimonadota bacterium]NCQ29856.1 tetratricopeptide repeat protein [Armatimonadota bacterium]NDK11937.1 tetratricopeptide repeat protein [Armatimonadota bacterium]